MMLYILGTLPLSWFALILAITPSYNITNIDNRKAVGIRIEAPTLKDNIIPMDKYYTSRTYFLMECLPQ